MMCPVHGYYCDWHEPYDTDWLQGLEFTAPDDIEIDDVSLSTILRRINEYNLA